MRSALRDFMKDSGLCPTPHHIAAQVCGYSENLAESGPPTSMRLQSPHEVAVQLDSGCHAIRPLDESADWTGFREAMRSEPVLANALRTYEPSGVDRRHDWDAAIRRVRSDEETQKSGEMPAVAPTTTPTTTQVVASAPSHDMMNREALALLDRSFELLRCNDVDGARAALRRAAEIEPNSKLVAANLRRLEQMTTTHDRARRRG
jgi:hypothetical protein